MLFYSPSCFEDIRSSFSLSLWSIPTKATRWQYSRVQSVVSVLERQRPAHCVREKRAGGEQVNGASPHKQRDIFCSIIVSRLNTSNNIRVFMFIASPELYPRVATSIVNERVGNEWGIKNSDRSERIAVKLLRAVLQLIF